MKNAKIMKFKLEIQPAPRIHTEALKWPSALLTATFQESLLSRESIELINMKVLKMGMWSSYLTSLNSLSGYLNK